MKDGIFKNRSPFSVDSGKENVHKRNSKQLMEKRRRTRINNCLETLKDIVLNETRQKDQVGQFSRLEKADILELVVKYVTDVQHQINSDANEATTTQATSQPDLDTQSYEEGYRQCANLTTRYLHTTHPVLPDRERVGLVTHLSAQFKPVSCVRSGENVLNDISENMSWKQEEYNLNPAAYNDSSNDNPAYNDSSNNDPALSNLQLPVPMREGNGPSFDVNRTESINVWRPW